MLRIEPDGPTSLHEWSGLIYAIPDATLTAIGREHGAAAIGLFVAPGGTHAALVIEGDELSDAVAGLIVDALTKRGLLPRVTFRAVEDPGELL